MTVNVKQASIAFLLCILALAINTLFKADWSTDTNNKEFELPEVGKAQPVRLKQIAYEQVLQAYESLQPSPSSDDNAENIAKQQEEKKRLEAAKKQKTKVLKPQFQMFDDNTQIGLVGIFRDDSTVAVFQTVKFDNDQIEYSRLMEGQSIGPFILKKIDKLSVTLESESRTLNLVLFKIRNS